MKGSWGLAVWEAWEGHWWKWSLSCRWYPRTKGVKLDKIKRAFERLLMKLCCYRISTLISYASIMGWLSWTSPMELRQAGKLGEVTSFYGRAQKITCGFQALEQEAVSLKLTWYDGNSWLSTWMNELQARNQGHICDPEQEYDEDSGYFFRSYHQKFEADWPW